ncbi:MAG: hypothetical protein M1839_007168 [Geoglossum umbratile]|nr:MAG: hypothetical protein M1839_007168 [Geoglossum umbratile]
MDAAELSPLIDQLEVQIDDLRDALEPLLATALSHHAAKLPLLDKAKLYVLTTYAIESLLFSILRLGGVNSREHPIFRELTRVKQYFEKIKQVEQSGIKRDNLSLDKEAVGRFVKHALAGNEKHDLKRAEQQAKERAKANINLEQLSRKRKVVRSESASPEGSEQGKWSANAQDKSLLGDANQMKSKPGGKDLSTLRIKRVEGSGRETESGGDMTVGVVKNAPPLGIQPETDCATAVHDPLKKPPSRTAEDGAQQGARKKTKISAKGNPK